MTRRFPLWLTIVPLAAAVGGYWYAWSGWRDDFHAELARVVPGSAVTIGGFPYRMEAEVGALARASRAPDIDARVSAASAVLNRGPWQRDLTIVRATQPRVAARIPSLASSGLSIAAPSAEMSVHLDQAGAVARLSTVFARATVGLALLGRPLTADKLEVHVRETPGRSDEAWSPVRPERAQLVLGGAGVRLGGGAPLTLAGDLGVNGPGKLVDFAHWAGEGSVAVRGLTLADKTGEVLRLDATLVADAGRPRLTGTIVTVCPATVRAAFAGASPVSEQRLRLAVRLAVGGAPGAWTLGGLPDAPRAVRAQQPPCPALLGAATGAAAGTRP